MLTTVSILLILTAVGLVYYWIDFYVKGGVQVINEDWYVKFQKAFPVADFWTAAVALAGAIILLAGHSFGFFFTLLAASSLIFLGLMDVTFNIQNKLYRFLRTSNEMRFELLINFWTLGFGIALIIFAWRNLV